MFDKEFLKTLTIMYVEDDESIRNSLSGILKKIFGEVIICNDGNDGINQFKYYTQERKSKIDTIISDINMPNLNGIEMAKEIRKLDENVPIIFTTAHGESNYLMEAIKLKIAYYALKPINTTDLLKNISKICMAEHNKQLIIQKEKQLQQYMDIMNGIASIFKIDTNGNIIEANEMLCEISGYTQEELLSMNISDILYKDSILTNYDDLVELIGSASKYEGKVKFASKDGEVFYLNSTIIPLYNDITSQHTGYLYIGLDQTDDELEKQQTMQRVRKNIIEQRSKESVLQRRIKELEEQVAQLQSSSVNDKDADFIKNALAKEKQKVTALNAQIAHYEKDIALLTKQKEHIIAEEKAKKMEMMKKVKELSIDNHNLQSKVIELQNQINALQAKLKGSVVE